jgi:hypothetical protein
MRDVESEVAIDGGAGPIVTGQRHAVVAMHCLHHLAHLCAASSMVVKMRKHECVRLSD